MKKVMQSLVPKSQSTFLAKRHIQDGVLIINKVLDFSIRNKKTCLMVKVDFHKAYDCVSWDYLRYILKIMCIRTNRFSGWRP